MFGYLTPAQRRGGRGIFYLKLKSPNEKKYLSLYPAPKIEIDHPQMNTSMN